MKPEMMKLTSTEVIDYLTSKVMEERPDMVKKNAKQLVLNALTYNVVVQEVIGQCMFLMGDDSI